MWCGTPLHVTAFHGNTEIAELLIKNEAKVHAKNVDGQTPLYRALYAAIHSFYSIEEQLPIINLLLEHQAEVDSIDRHGYTPLHRAVRWGPKEAVELLLDNKADVNTTDNRGDTPLDCIVEAITKAKGTDPQNHIEFLLEIAKLLIANGADVNAVAERYFPPFSFATWRNKNNQAIKNYL